VFLVADSAKRPVAGASVAFAVVYGGGAIVAASAVTDAQGLASPGTWRLGQTPGLNAVVASVGSVNITAQVNAVAIATPVSLSINSDSILYAGVVHQQSVVVDSTALVAVRKNGKTYFYYAGLGSSPTTLSDSLSGLSLSRRIVALMETVRSASGIRGVKALYQSSNEVVAGVQITSSDNFRYSFNNTEGRMVGLKFTPSPSLDSEVVLAPFVDVSTPLQNLLTSVGISSVQYARSVTIPTTIEVFGSIAARSALSPSARSQFDATYGNAVVAAVNSDSSLWARINAYDSDWIAASLTAEITGHAPCAGAIAPALLFDLQLVFLAAEHIQQSLSAYDAALASMLSKVALEATSCFDLGVLEPYVQGLETSLNASDLVGDLKDVEALAAVAPYGKMVLGPPPPTVWSDGFESYQPGLWPAQWIPDGNASDATANYTDSTVSFAGTRSLRLYGAANGCLAGIAYRPLTVSPPFEVEVAVRNGGEALSGCHPYRALVQLRHCCTWTNPARQLVLVTKDGVLRSGGGDSLATLQSLTWYQLRVRYEVTSASVVTVYYWLNGGYLGSETLPRMTAEGSLQHVDLEAEEGTVWFDNATIAH
jgi:hypothetical protein